MKIDGEFYDEIAKIWERIDDLACAGGPTHDLHEAFVRAAYAMDEVLDLVHDKLEQEEHEFLNNVRVAA